MCFWLLSVLENLISHEIYKYVKYENTQIWQKKRRKEHMILVERRKEMRYFLIKNSKYPKHLDLSCYQKLSLHFKVL